MAAREAGAVRAALIAAGVRADTPLALVESASLEARRASGVLRQLEALLAGRGQGPVTIVLGKAMASAVVQRPLQKAASA
jgi:siroheme synthase